MTRSTARWLAYALAAALTAAAMVWVNDDGPAETVLPTLSRTGTAAVAGPGAGQGASPLALAAVVARPGVAPVADPFAVGSGMAPEQAAQAAAQLAVAPAGPPMAPVMPFSFLGRWKEQGKTIVFLQRGDLSYKVDGPGALDSEYAVQAIDEQRIALKYLPLGIVQDLRLDAPVRSAQKSAVAAEPPANEPQTGN